MTYQERISDIRQQGGINFHFPLMPKGGVKPGSWNHICMAYNSEARHLVYIHNGEITFNYTNAPLAFEVEVDGLPKMAFSPRHRRPSKNQKNKLCIYLNNSDRKFFHTYCMEVEDDPDNPECTFAKTSVTGGSVLVYEDDFNGFVTDHNIWSRTLSIPEMKAWTTCGSFEKGDLLPWNHENWTPTVRFFDGSPVVVHSEVEVNTDDFCPSTSQNGKTYTLFPDNIFSHPQGLHLCKQFNGEMAHSRTLEEGEIVNSYIASEWKKHGIKEKGVYYRYTDEEENGLWKDPETGFVASMMNCPDDPDECYGVIQWNLNHEPEGGDGENCAAGLQKSAGLERSSYDLGCAIELSIACEEISREIVLRGLCPLSKFGKKYLISPNYFEERRFFNGYTGWKLSYENDAWSLRHPSISDTYAKYTESKYYPMGRKVWEVTNDVCSGKRNIIKTVAKDVFAGSGTAEVTLLLTACSDDQFTCDDGTCIDMIGRCNRKADCKVTISVGQLNFK